MKITRNKVGATIGALVVAGGLVAYLQNEAHKTKPQKPVVVEIKPSPQPTPTPEFEETIEAEQTKPVKRAALKTAGGAQAEAVPQPTIPPPTRPERDRNARVAYPGDRLPLPNGEWLDVPPAMFIGIHLQPYFPLTAAHQCLAPKFQQVAHSDGTYDEVPTGEPILWTDVIAHVRDTQTLPTLEGCMLNIPQIDGSIQQWFFSSCATVDCSEAKDRFK